MKKKDNQYSVDYKEHGYTLFLNMQEAAPLRAASLLYLFRLNGKWERT